MANEICIGIDLGTTFSAVGYWNKDHCEIIPNKDGKNTTPSWVSFTNTEILIGDRARAQANINQKNTLFDIKRLIGKRFTDEQLQEDLLNYPFTVVPDGNNAPVIKIEYKNEELSLRPEQISAYILIYLKESAEEKLGVKIKNAVITVPAYFNNAQRESTKQAANIAGLNCIRIINEPTAACLCYGLDKKEDNTKVLIFDLGGGTFDVSVLSLNRGIFEVCATSGDTHLGGEDFDNELVKYFISDYELKSGCKLNCTNKILRKLKNIAETAKCVLSISMETFIEFETDEYEYVQILTRSKFEKICDILFNKCMQPVKQALTDSGINRDDINEIILVGGSTRIPQIRALLSQFFNGKKLNMSIHPDEAVAYGAAVQAAILSDSDESGKTSELLLLDVIPLSMGVESKGGIMSKIIERNTQIPVKKTKMYSTTIDKQTSVDIKIYEGEREFTSENHKLADFKLTDIPKQARGVPKIKVTFSIDNNGILSVHAVEEETGINSEITITDSTRLTQEEINAMIDDADQHRADDELRKAALNSKYSYEKYLNEMQRAICDPELMHDDAGVRIIPEEDTILMNNCILSNLLWLENTDLSKELIDDTKKSFEFNSISFLNKIYQRKKQLEFKNTFMKEEKQENISIY